MYISSVDNVPFRIALSILIICTVDFTFFLILHATPFSYRFCQMSELIISIHYFQFVMYLKCSQFHWKWQQKNQFFFKCPCPLWYCRDEYLMKLSYTKLTVQLFQSNRYYNFNNIVRFIFERFHFLDLGMLSKILKQCVREKDISFCSQYSSHSLLMRSVFFHCVNVIK